MRKKLIRDYSDLTGRTIVSVERLSDEELDDLGGWRHGISLTLDDNTLVLVSQDDEGNDGGSLMHSDLDGNLVSIYS